MGTPPDPKINFIAATHALQKMLIPQLPEYEVVALGFFLVNPAAFLYVCPLSEAAASQSLLLVISE